jgi:hypothetical protein
MLLLVALWLDGDQMDTVSNCNTSQDVQRNRNFFLKTGVQQIKIHGTSYERPDGSDAIKYTLGVELLI